ncbi:type II toxin-antitoxin system Phd/YefM family antitoxin [Massilia sp. MB5]|uniref:type II toxin-antitoxin system Phd/YefM family antitoxin n=1 Tax=unclassified Massilia TaxID=2609279 RepID=UPI00067BFCC2|nr:MULTISPECIES: type II toxin-antitoxin system Phd/YefM family antitoxin [unclassified Massilia]AKU21700.1 hypothetical protein ACZ75_09710 [Massilia sp. NR 4-1]UMR28687.1 type II toxin-antitoxin system Phd/YefM family antitoxin [Massilia sp. MB5]
MLLSKTRPISYLKSNTAELAEELKNDQNDILITQNGAAAFVCVPIERYESNRQALALLRLLNMGKQEVEQGRHSDAGEAMSALEQELFPEGQRKKV